MVVEVGQDSLQIRQPNASNVVITISGRHIPAPPRVTDSRSLLKLKKWLILESSNEARSRLDEFNLSIFSHEVATNLPQASMDSMNLYMFGEEYPSWKMINDCWIRERSTVISQQPKVRPAILKDL